MTDQELIELVLRAREGDRMRITFLNGSEHPHTIHWHGIHPAEMDGVPGIGAGVINPGGSTVYELTPSPTAFTCTTATSGPWPSTSPRACTARS